MVWSLVEVHNTYMFFYVAILNNVSLIWSSIYFSVPSVKILGDKEMYVKAGTAVTLRCLISNCLEEPAYVFWYHGDRRLLDDEDQIPGKFLLCSIY